MDPRGPQWQELEPDEIVTWQPVQPAQPVEGPLSLALLDGRRLVLELAPDQLAFRDRDGRLEQVYFDGIHELVVGEGTDRVDPTSRLFFVRGDVPFHGRWRESAVLHVPGLPGPLPLRGAYTLVIDDPAGFHDGVLRGLEHLEPGQLAGVLDTMLRAQIEGRLEALDEDPAIDPVRVQIMLNGLTADDLNEDLLDLGLRCLHLAAVTPLPRPDEAPTPAEEGVLAGSYDDVL
jgi:hypothetical protein